MTRMTHIVDATTVPADRLHQAFTEAFSDYLIGPFEVALAQWPAFLARQGVDLGLSRVAIDAQGEPLAFAFVAPRPSLRRWRLGTMGARPAARGTGAASALLDNFIGRAREAGQRAVELEVFASNDRARQLYERHGFRRVDTLHGFIAEPGSLPVAPPAEIPREVDRDAMLAWLDAAEQRLPDLPLQVTAASLRHATDLRAWQLGETGGWAGPDASAAPRAQLVFGLPEGTAQVHSLIAPDPDQARALVAALAAMFPQRRLRVPQLQRDALGGHALRALGAVEQPLHQWLMRRDL